VGLALQSHTCLLWRVSSHTPLYLFFFLRFKCTIKKIILYFNYYSNNITCFHGIVNYFSSQLLVHNMKKKLMNI
jgi:hypothetical protein